MTFLFFTENSENNKTIGMRSSMPYQLCSSSVQSCLGIHRMIVFKFITSRKLHVLASVIIGAHLNHRNQNIYNRKNVNMM